MYNPNTIMNLNKWSNILKIILLKVVEEIERRINESKGADTSDHLGASIYTSLKFIVLEQVDGLVDEATSFAKHQINELSTLIAEKISSILASMVYILILIGMLMLTFILFIISLSIYLGQIMGEMYYGFLTVGGILAILTFIVFRVSHHAIAGRIKRHLLKLI